LTGSRKWPGTAWRRLLELALPVLDEIGPGVDWTLGGGTALALKLNHRVSYDVDIFMENAGHLHALSPTRNAAARALTDRWQEPGHYLKLERPEGEIDFIVAARLTGLRPWLYDFRGREIAVETPAEILAKKLKYRGSRLLPRDIFDILALRRSHPAAIGLASAAVPDGARRAADRIRRIAPRYRETVHEEVNSTSAGAELLEIDPLEAAEVLSVK
jgi:hypothetical protein